MLLTTKTTPVGENAMKKLLTALSVCLLSACLNAVSTEPLDDRVYLLQTR